jgi:hypothetical protein
VLDAGERKAQSIGTVLALSTSSYQVVKGGARRYQGQFHSLTKGIHCPIPFLHLALARRAVV